MTSPRSGHAPSPFWLRPPSDPAPHGDAHGGWGVCVCVSCARPRAAPPSPSPARTCPLRSIFFFFPGGVLSGFFFGHRDAIQATLRFPRWEPERSVRGPSGLWAVRIGSFTPPNSPCQPPPLGQVVVLGRNKL